MKPVAIRMSCARRLELAIDLLADSPHGVNFPRHRSIICHGPSIAPQPTLDSFRAPTGIDDLPLVGRPLPKLRRAFGTPVGVSSHPQMAPTGISASIECLLFATRADADASASGEFSS